MKKFLLALFTFTQKLNIVDYKGINSPELVLEAGQIALFNGPYESIDKLFTAKEPDGGICKFPFRFVADRMLQMCFTQTDIAVQK